MSKTLHLYVDKWCIVAAVSNDGQASLIHTETGEPFFWLFFHEDLNKERVFYGIGNKQPFYEGKPHYIGDVMQLITDARATFLHFGRQKAMPHIFEESGMWQEFRNAVGMTQGQVPTFITFANDLSDAARVVMLEQLRNANFQVQQSSARVDHLALEHALKCGYIPDQGHFLVLNAYNEQLHFSLYQRQGNLFLRLGQEVLSGMGTDPRRRALVEDIVQRINLAHRILKTEEEKEKEYCNLLQNADHWLVKIDTVSIPRPIDLGEVHLSIVPNSFRVTVLKADIDRRTNTIVDDIMRVIAQFVQKHLPQTTSLQGILLLGGSFSNHQFTQALSARFTIPKENYVHFTMDELPRIMAVYEHIDCKQFSSEEGDTTSRGLAELVRIKNAQEEEERERQAKEQIEQQRYAEAQRDKDERDYRNAIEKANECERKGDYSQMEEFADIALSKKPESEEAKSLKEDAIRLRSEAKVRNEQLNGIIHRIGKAYEQQQWQDVLSLCDAALNLEPQNGYAQNKRQEARQKLDNVALVEKHLTRADLFLANRNYNEALNELEKVLLLEHQHTEALERKTHIEQLQREEQQQVSALQAQVQTAETQHDYPAAIAAAEQLLALDHQPQLWAQRLEQLKRLQEQHVQHAARFATVKRLMADAQFDARWDEAQNHCHEALELAALLPHMSEETIELERQLSRIQQRLHQAEAEAQFAVEVSTVKECIASHQWDEARQRINALRQQHPEREQHLRQLSAKLFEAEDAYETKRRELRRPTPPLFEEERQPQPRSNEGKKPVSVSGFNVDEGRKTGTSRRTDADDDFFSDTPSPQRKSQPSPQRKADTPAKRTSDDDFFDDTPSPQRKSKPSPQRKADTPAKRISDDDFFDNVAPPRRSSAPTPPPADDDDDFFFSDTPRAQHRPSSAASSRSQHRSSVAGKQSSDVCSQSSVDFEKSFEVSRKNSLLDEFDF